MVCTCAAAEVYYSAFSQLETAERYSRVGISMAPDTQVATTGWEKFSSRERITQTRRNTWHVRYNLRGNALFTSSPWAMFLLRDARPARSQSKLFAG